MKKKVFLIALLVLVFCCIPTVFAVDAEGCKTVLPNVSIDAKIANLVRTVILVIQIAVPVVLVIFGMLDLFKGITAQKEDEIKKGQQTFIKRLFAAVLVFFVIAIVKLLIGFVSNDTNINIFDCADCFINGVNEDGTCN